jgi:hypothetical protein
MTLRTSFITSGPMPSPGNTSRLRLELAIPFLQAGGAPLQWRVMSRKKKTRHWNGVRFANTGGAHPAINVS